MNKYYIFIVIVLFILTIIYEKRVKEQALRKLYKLKMEKDSEGFNNLLDSLAIKLTFNAFTREFMRLGYYIDTNNDEGVKNTLVLFEKMKLKENDLIALYSKLLGYYLEKKDYAKAEKNKDKLVNLLKDKKDDKSKLMLGEIEQIDAIYIRKDTSILEDLEETLESIDNDEAKSILCFRIAKLYHYRKDNEKVDNYLKRSIEYSSNEAQKRSIEEMLADHSKLD